MSLYCQKCVWLNISPWLLDTEKRKTQIPQKSQYSLCVCILRDVTSLPNVSYINKHKSINTGD